MIETPDEERRKRLNLCRRCHMLADGRLAAWQARNHARAAS